MVEQQQQDILQKVLLHFAGIPLNQDNYEEISLSPEMLQFSLCHNYGLLSILEIKFQLFEGTKYSTGFGTIKMGNVEEAIKLLRENYQVEWSGVIFTISGIQNPNMDLSQTQFERSVLIVGLPMSQFYSPAELFELCRQCGDLDSLKLMTDPQGRSTGRCELIYTTRTDAENAALCLDEQQLSDNQGRSFIIRAILSQQNVEAPPQQRMIVQQQQKKEAVQQKKEIEHQPKKEVLIIAQNYEIQKKAPEEIKEKKAQEEVKEAKVNKNLDTPTPQPPNPKVQAPKRYLKVEVVYPNANHFPDPGSFWNQDMINMFMNENWVKNSNDKQQQAYSTMEKYTVCKRQVKQMTLMLSTMPEGSPLMQQAIDNIEQQHAQMREILAQNSPFELINCDQEQRIYQIDLHGMTKADAEEQFNKSYFHIVRKLRSGEYENNMAAMKREHVIKVICGYGHHSQGPTKGTLKIHFLQYFKENLFNFAYAEQHGAFLLKVKY